jgi:hypothetical protein
MSQHKGSKKSASDALAGMESQMKSLLIAVATITFVRFMISFLNIWLDWPIVLFLAFANLIALAALLVVTVKNDSERVGATNSGSNLRGGFYLASGIAILGILGYFLLNESPLFGFLYNFGSIAVVTLTILRAKNEGDRDATQSSETTKKSGGLL